MFSQPFPIVPHETVSAAVAAEPAYNALNSLSLLNAVDHLPGLDPWVERTAATLSPEQRHTNRLVFDGLGAALISDQRWPSFPAYLDGLAAENPIALRDRLLHRRRHPGPALVEPELQALLSDVDAYLGQLERLYLDAPVDRELHAEAHALLNDPRRLQDVVVNHLGEMWHTTLAMEWKRRVPPVEGIATWLNSRVAAGATAAETIRAFIGHDLPRDHSTHLDRVWRVIFVPSPHMGQYVNSFGSAETVWLFFGLQNPRVLRSAPVAPAELVMRLGALADDTRLRILQLVAQHDEISAQEIITRLDLSQSAASRHLKQLSGAGYVVERRGEGANKKYHLDPHHVEWVFRSLERFLAGEAAEQRLAEIAAGHPQDLRRFLDGQGRVAKWPAKQQDKLVVLQYLESRFEPGQPYSEKEVNDVLNQWHTFGDHVTLRRYLVDFGYLKRERDGSRYWRDEVMSEADMPA